MLERSIVSEVREGIEPEHAMRVVAHDAKTPQERVAEKAADRLSRDAAELAAEGTIDQQHVHVRGYGGFASLVLRGRLGVALSAALSVRGAVTLAARSAVVARPCSPDSPHLDARGADQARLALSHQRRSLETVYGRLPFRGSTQQAAGAHEQRALGGARVESERQPPRRRAAPRNHPNIDQHLPTRDDSKGHGDRGR